MLALSFMDNQIFFYDENDQSKALVNSIENLFIRHTKDGEHKKQEARHAFYTRNRIE